MAEASNPHTWTFIGERVTWVCPATLEELVQLKTANPKAPLIMGNTNIGERKEEGGSSVKITSPRGSSGMLGGASSGSQVKLKEAGGS